MMEKISLCLLFLMFIGLVASNNLDDPSQLSGEDNKLTGLLFRQAQDMGSIMTDVKTLIMLESQQQSEIDGIKQNNFNAFKTEINLKIRQMERDIEEMKSLMNNQLQKCDTMQEVDSLRGNCDGNITGLTTWYFDQSPIAVPCDGMGYVVILRRVAMDSQSYNFITGTWEQYKNGFGNPTGSFFIGLEVIHRYTSKGSTSLRVELEDWAGETSWAEYSYMLVLGEDNGYRLMVSGYAGTPGDSLSYHSGMKFTTKNQDNDFSSHNRATFNAGAWWHNIEPNVLPTAAYVTDGTNVAHAKGIIWSTWKGKKYSLKKVEMKLRLN